MSEQRTMALIDDDIIVYQVASQCETAIDWGNDLWTLHSDLSVAKDLYEQRVKEIQAETNSDYLTHTLSDSTGNYFRKEIYPKYKANRKGTRKPLVWRPLREWVKETYQAYERPGLEGDDVLGILATMDRPTWTSVVLVSIDKDFKTIPCTYYNFAKKETLTTSPADAAYWHYYQTLTGDTADGYPGCPGVGPKTATALLSPYKGETGFDERGAWRMVVETYRKKGLGEAVAVQMARCARILRACDYDFYTKQPILWEPPK